MGHGSKNGEISAPRDPVQQNQMRILRRPIPYPGATQWPCMNPVPTARSVATPWVNPDASIAFGNRHLPWTNPPLAPRNLTPNAVATAALPSPTGPISTSLIITAGVMSASGVGPNRANPDQPIRAQNPAASSPSPIIFARFSASTSRHAWILDRRAILSAAAFIASASWLRRGSRITPLPTPPPPPCPRPGCPHRRPCPDHPARPAWRQRTYQGPHPNTSASGKAWRRAVLLRAQGACEVCGDHASLADHIVPLAKGGP